MDNEFVKWLVQTGGTGAIAALIFYFYRKDVRSYTDLWKETSVMLASEMRESRIAYTAVVEKSTAAHVTNSETNREMIGLLQALHRRLDIQHVPPASSEIPPPRL